MHVYCARKLRSARGSFDKKKLMDLNDCEIPRKNAVLFSNSAPLVPARISSFFILMVAKIDSQEENNKSICIRYIFIHIVCDTLREESEIIFFLLKRINVSVLNVPACPCCN